MSLTNLSDKEEEHVSRPDTPVSSASDDSFHSADNDDSSPAQDGEKSQASTRECSEGGSESSEELCPDVPVIEPDCQEKSKSDASLTPDTKSGGSESLEDFGIKLDKEKEEDEEEEDFVDEEYLKDLELSMTEEEKEEKKKESLIHKEKGNTSFKTGQYEEAVSAYTVGLRICPISFPRERSVLYANRAAARSKIDKKKEAIKDCTNAIDLDSTYLKAILRRATLNEETEQLDEALKDFQRVLELDPSHVEAQRAVRRLPTLIDERNEKLKEEMLGKLKDLGNMFLRPFGLSTNNFQLQQDPNTGGYNISFQQNEPKPQ
ncbi:tetratricopeptide repeat protein 1 [Penaeus vannamei]|uniref:tetratricopeptide repeat protein 1 n=1 Tax=Penaeus vannamei TaxID=6689 RepID=UPI000F6791B2|nr:tetratricopeptide repeat protein 1-like [Penaeus vannamei]